MPLFVKLTDPTAKEARLFVNLDHVVTMEQGTYTTVLKTDHRCFDVSETVEQIQAKAIAAQAFTIAQQMNAAMDPDRIANAFKKDLDDARNRDPR